MQWVGEEGSVAFLSLYYQIETNMLLHAAYK